MRWLLCSAVLRCAARRLGPLARANPLLAGVAIGAASFAPAGAVWLGRRSADSFGVALAVGGFAEAVALAVAATALVAGMSVALLAPGVSALGPQVAAAPLPRRALVVGGVLGPMAAFAAPVVVVLGCFAVALAGRRGVTIALVAGAAGGVGGMVGESLRLVARRRAVGAFGIVAAAAVWSVVGLVGDGAGYLGPAAAPDGPAGAGALSLVVVGAVGVAAWVVLCGVRRAESPPARRARLRRLPARAGPAVAVAAARRVFRHPHLRTHAVTAVAGPLVAAVAVRFALGEGGEATTVLCVVVALTAVALHPSAALGLMRAAWWLVRAAPVGRSAAAGAATAGGVATAAVLLVAVAVLAAPLGAAGARTSLQLEAAAAFVLGCSAAAGGVVPWHAEQPLRQLASYVAVALVVLGAWAALGWLEPLVDGGPAFALVAGHGALLLGVCIAAAVAR